MSQQNKGKLHKMKTVFNKKDENEDFSSNDKFTNEKPESLIHHNNDISRDKAKLSERDKSYHFRNTVDVVDIKSFKNSEINVEKEPAKAKCEICVNQCLIY